MHVAPLHGRAIVAVEADEHLLVERLCLESYGDGIAKELMDPAPVRLRPRLSSCMAVAVAG